MVLKLGFIVKLNVTAKLLFKLKLNIMLKLRLIAQFENIKKFSLILNILEHPKNTIFSLKKHGKLVDCYLDKTPLTISNVLYFPVHYL